MATQAISNYRRIFFITALGVAAMACTPPAKPPQPPFAPTAEVIPATVRMEGSVLLADVITHGLARTGSAITLKARLTGPGVDVAVDRSCSLRETETHVCDSVRWASGGQFRSLESSGFVLPTDGMAEGSYTITIAAGSMVIGSYALELVSVPMVGGKRSLVVVPPKPTIQGSLDGLVVWLPTDARMRGEHQLDLLWFSESKLIAKTQRVFSSGYAYVSEDGRAINLATPVVGSQPVFVAPPSEAQFGSTITLLAILDTKAVLASWTFKLDAAKGFVGPGGVSFADWQFGEPWNFLSTMEASAPDPELVAQSQAIARAETGHYHYDRLLPETTVCGAATKTEATALFEELANLKLARTHSDGNVAGAVSSAQASAEKRAATLHGRRASQRELDSATHGIGGGTGSRGRVEKANQKILSLGKGQKAGCLRSIVGPLLAAQLPPL